MKARVAKMVEATKAFVARSLDAQLGPIEVRLVRLEAAVTVLEAQLAERGPDERLRAVK